MLLNEREYTLIFYVLFFVC